MPMGTQSTGAVVDKSLSGEDFGSEGDDYSGCDSTHMLLKPGLDNSDSSVEGFDEDDLADKQGRADGASSNRKSTGMLTRSQRRRSSGLSTGSEQSSPQSEGESSSRRICRLSSEPTPGTEAREAFLAPSARRRSRQSKPTLVFDQLPSDAIRLVLRKCDGRSLQAFSCVSKRLHREICEDERLWRSCCMELPFAALGFENVEALLWEENGKTVSWRHLFNVYSRILSNDLISCTGLEPDKKNFLKQVIESMGGKYQGHLDRQVTVLVVGQTGTDKYKFAKHEKIHLVTKEWVCECFKKRRRLSTSDFAPHIFLGLKFCATQIQAGVRQYIEDEAGRKGGEYTADLRKDHNTHLLAVRPDGRKFEFAHRWKMKVLTPNWFFDCLAKDEYVDEQKYEIPNPAERGGAEILS